jgi:anti-sigma28 factor (negative regulator of flagellin synthesis)
MNRETQSENNSGVGTGTGLMEPPTENTAQFSHLEARVDNLVVLVLSFPDLRSARVQELKVQIAAGTHDVTSEQLAAALFDHLRTRTDCPLT